MNYQATERNRAPRAPAEEALVSVKQLGLRRGGRWIVRHVNLTVRRGEILTVIGPNGGGKSATARAILGILPHQEGEIIKNRRLAIGYVPQKIQIDETLPLPVSRLMTLTRNYPKRRVQEALDEMGVLPLMRAPVQSLSGGEFQRCLLARALLPAPDLLVLDEPAQGLDATGEIEFYRKIREIRQERQCGILLISHDLHIVMRQTDTVVCLNGHVCCSGQPRAVASSPEYQKLFGVSAAEALALYSHDHDHRHP